MCRRVAALGVATYLVAANSQHDDHKAHGGARKAGSGPLTNATVSFGAWKTSPPVDRFPNKSDTRNDNVHVVIPDVAKIKAGGTVNFIIAGFHQVIVYDDGTQPGDINTSITVFADDYFAVPAAADRRPNRRIYRGRDPSLSSCGPGRGGALRRAGHLSGDLRRPPAFSGGHVRYVRVVP